MGLLLVLLMGKQFPYKVHKLKHERGSETFKCGISYKKEIQKKKSSPDVLNVVSVHKTKMGSEARKWETQK